jgi:hypothetical protein
LGNPLFIQVAVISDCFLIRETSRFGVISRTIPPKAEGIIPRSLLRNLSSELALRLHTCDSFIKNCSKQANYVMTYFHPRDFDAHQPND